MTLGPVIIASRSDQFAQQLVAQWAIHGAVLLTSADLCVKGWRYRLGSIEDARIMINGQAITTKDIRGVLNRLPAVFEQELIEITSVDRSYVAAEMTAFLLSWLSALKCPVLNPPTPTCLSGPYWRQEQWISAAAHVGISVRPFQRRTCPSTASLTEPSLPHAISLTVIGHQCIGAADSALAVQALRLADATHVDLLAVRFSCPEAGAFLVNANPWPDFTTTEVMDTILAYLQGQGKKEYRYR